jgi:acetylornithine deacetylase
MKDRQLRQQLCDRIDPQRIIDDLQAMIAIPSMNPFQRAPAKDYREQEIAEFYCDRMSDLGLDVGTRAPLPGRPNVWGILRGKGTGPALMLAGHLDTVGNDNYPHAFDPRVENGRVYGRGACDMKDALASYLEVARLLREADLQLAGDLILTGIADEEDQMIGSRDLGKHGPWADYGVIGEPTDLAVCSAHKGQVGYRLRVLGKAVHSSRPEDGVNAIEGAARVIEALGEHQKSLMRGKFHRLCGYARCCPSVIHGGTIVSTVPDKCEIEIDRRTLPGETREDVYRELENLIAGIRRSQPQFEFEIEGPIIDVLPLDVPAGNLIVDTVLNAYRSATGNAIEASAFSGGTDAPHLGFPTLVFGAGSLHQAHSVNEYVEIDEMLVATRVYLATALDILHP